MDDHICNNIINIIGGAGISILFLISELMPFITSVKSNGLVEALVSLVKKEKKPIDYDSDDDDYKSLEEGLLNL